ncbi:hypothetical protein ACQEV9_44755 [Streptomyces chartreusis]|uniref:hypothetical protein n=1 Tax=Streptomyces chartreusis TaxID=1969 RepID=UPI003D932051
MPKKQHPARVARATRKASILDLAALLLLLTVSAGLFHFIGPAGFSVVVGTGVGLFASWRTRR